MKQTGELISWTSTYYLMLYVLNGPPNAKSWNCFKKPEYNKFQSCLSKKPLMTPFFSNCLTVMSFQSWEVISEALCIYTAFKFSTHMYDFSWFYYYLNITSHFFCFFLGRCYAEIRLYCVNYKFLKISLPMHL